MKSRMRTIMIMTIITITMIADSDFDDNGRYDDDKEDGDELCL